MPHTLRPSAILCADWGKQAHKRAVYVAEVDARRIKRVPNASWSFGAVLDEAARWTDDGSVLVTFDVALGLPESYMAAARRVPSWGSPSSFLEFLAIAHSSPRFFEATSSHDCWRIEQPFFSVPAGKGGLHSYVMTAAQQGVGLRRAVDKETGAKPLFATSGIPGTVGSAVCALWRDLGPLLVGSRKFRVWPFEGELHSLLESTPIVIGEIYPRAAYATALLDRIVAERPRLAVAKTNASVRHAAIEQLRTAQWVRRLGVRIEDLATAEANEDDFDACTTAAALLRCVLEKLSMCSLPAAATRAEGGILGTGSINFDLREESFAGVAGSSMATGRARTRGTAAKTIRCPIAGCAKVFLNGRGGWDAHVGSRRSHQDWHPDLTAVNDRKRQFQNEFPEFFR
jgi:hypothetical protein